MRATEQSQGGNSSQMIVSARAKRSAEADVKLRSLIQRSPRAAASTGGLNSSSPIQSKPGFQNRLSR